MLVLSRRAGQKIVIGNEIVIEVLSVSGEGVRIGVSAPTETSVHRYEVFTEIQEANQAAGVVSGDVERSVLKDISTFLRGKQE